MRRFSSLKMIQKTGVPKTKGFTLPELLIAAAILAFALLAILASFVSCFLLNEANRNLTVAITHAQYVMEEIKNTGFDSIRNDGNSQWDWDSATIATKGLIPIRNEGIDTQVTGTDLLDVGITVSWQDRGGRNRSTHLETLIAQP